MVSKVRFVKDQQYSNSKTDLIHMTFASFVEWNPISKSNACIYSNSFLNKTQHCCRFMY